MPWNRTDVWRISGADLLLQLDDVHYGECLGRPTTRRRKTISATKVSAWLSRVVQCAFPSVFFVFCVPDDEVAGLTGAAKPLSRGVVVASRITYAASFYTT